VKPLSVESLALLRSLVERHGVENVAWAVGSMREPVPVCRAHGCECEDHCPCWRRRGEPIGDLERLDVDGIDWVWIQFSDLEPMVMADISARIGGGMAMSDRYSGLDGRSYRWG